MEIKKGMKFRCIKTVVMESGETCYIKDGIYISHNDGCITDIQFDKKHIWKDCKSEDFFVLFNEGYSLETIRVHCNTQDEFDEVLNWHSKQKHVSAIGKLPLYFKENWEIYETYSYITLCDKFQYGDVSSLKDNNIILSYSVFVHDFIETEDWRKNIDTNIRPIISQNTSVKNDFIDGKLRWDLLPLDLIEELVKVYDYGAKKYYPESWKEIPDGYQRLKGAALRHLVAFEKGETIDSESGLNHLVQASWNLLTCYYYANKEKEEE